MSPSLSRRQQGMTLVELMVAMVLGLVVIAGAITLLLANRTSYRTSEGLSQLQEGARTAFEMMARDIRQAGVTGCDNAGNVANLLVGSDWWRQWFIIRGYDSSQTDPAVTTGSALQNRVAGTDSIHLQGVAGQGVAMDTHTPASGTMLLRDNGGFAAGTVLLACDFDHAAIFRAASYDAGSRTVTYAEDADNCSLSLAMPACSAGNYLYERNSLVGPLSAVAWYVGNNGRTEDSGRSLYRVRLGNDGNLVTEEVVSDIADMQILYRVDDAADFVDADDTSLGSAAAWERVNAVRITFTVDSADAGISTDRAANEGRLRRQFTQLITLRNRVP